MSKTQMHKVGVIPFDIRGDHVLCYSSDGNSPFTEQTNYTFTEVAVSDYAIDESMMFLKFYDKFISLVVH